MDCKNHPGTEALAQCTLCTQPFCGECLVYLNGQRFCRECQVVATQRRAPSPTPPLSPRTYASPPPMPAPKTSGLAIASLVLGVLAIVTCGITAIPGLICGIIALVKIGRSEGRLQGQGLAIGGLVISGLFMFIIPIYAAIMFPALARAREAARRASCQNHLKQMGLVYKMFDNDSKGKLPELSSEPGRLMCDAKSIFPEYLSDPVSILLCPSDSEHSREQYTANPESAIDDESYIYLGYVITSDDELKAFEEVYKQRTAKGLKFDEDLPAPPGHGSAGTDTFYRLAEDVEQKLTTAGKPLTQAQIPIMWDKFSVAPGKLMFNHIPGGSNVLYMDGHVEFLKYPGPFPLTQPTGGLLAEMDATHR